eukprot:g34488.t1
MPSADSSAWPRQLRQDFPAGEAGRVLAPGALAERRTALSGLNAAVGEAKAENLPRLRFHDGIGAASCIRLGGSTSDKSSSQRADDSGMQSDTSSIWVFPIDGLLEFAQLWGKLQSQGVDSKALARFWLGEKGSTEQVTGNEGSENGRCQNSARMDGLDNHALLGVCKLLCLEPAQREDEIRSLVCSAAPSARSLAAAVCAPAAPRGPQHNFVLLQCQVPEGALGERPQAVVQAGLRACGCCTSSSVLVCPSFSGCPPRRHQWPLFSGALVDEGQVVFARETRCGVEGQTRVAAKQVRLWLDALLRTEPEAKLVVSYGALNPFRLHSDFHFAYLSFMCLSAFLSCSTGCRCFWHVDPNQGGEDTAFPERCGKPWELHRWMDNIRNPGRVRDVSTRH